MIQVVHFHLTVSILPDLFGSLYDLFGYFLEILTCLY